MELTEFVNFYATNYRRISTTDIKKARESVAFLEGYSAALSITSDSLDVELCSSNMARTSEVLDLFTNFIETLNEKAYS